MDTESKIVARAPLIALRALLDGVEIPDQPYPLKLVNDQLVWVLCNGTYVGCDMSVGAFVRLCRNLTEEELVGLAANNALRQITARR